ncbi:MAG: hypothetical protein OHK0029_21160 [Armatimonadaceae bacterium]
MERSRCSRSQQVSPPDLRLSRRSLFVLGASTCAAMSGVAGLVRLPRQDGVEVLLKNVPPASDWTIQNGRLYILSIGMTEHTVYEAPLTGGEVRVLARIPHERQVVTDALFTEKELLILARPRDLATGTGVTNVWGQGLSGYGDILPQFDTGEYRHSPVRRDGETVRRQRRRYWNMRQTSNLYRVALADGGLQSVALDVQGHLPDSLPRRLTPEGLFYVHHRQDVIYLIESEKAGAMRMRTERTADDQLFFAPLDGSPAQSLLSGVLFSRLLVDEAAGDRIVYARMPRCYPDRRHDLYQMTRNGKVTVLPDYSGSGVPISLGGRLYWLEPHFLIGDDGAKTPVNQLVSSLPDGSDRQVLWQTETDSAGKPVLKYLFAHGGRLYGQQVRQVPPRHRSGSDEAEFDLEHYLVRLHPDRADILGASRMLPEGVGALYPHVENGYYFFLHVNSHRDLLDPFSERTRERRSISLCRVPLPGEVV